MAGLFETLSAQSYFGSTLLQYVFFLTTVGLFIIAGKVFSYVVKIKLRAITEKTKTKIDDFLLDLVEQPLWLLALIIGLSLGTGFLTMTAEAASFFQNVLNILGILIFGWIASKSIDAFVREFIEPLAEKTESKLDDQLIPVVRKVSKGIIVILVLLVIVGSFGYDITAVVAGLGIGGLAFAFAAKETIGDLFGGISIFASKPFVVGEFIELKGGVMGEVVEVGLRHTRIRNLDKRIVIVPNSKMANTIITNITSAPQRKCVWHLGVTYSTPVKKLEKAKQIIVDAINQHPECENDPIVEFEEFGDFSLKILVLFFNKKNDFKEFVRVRGAIGMQIKREFEKNKIDFAFPTQTIHLKK